MAKILLIAAVSILGTVCAYKTGAPNTDEVCKTMIPGHQSTIQPLDTFPYKVTVHPTSTKPGGSVTVTITGNSDNPIRGFFVQARVDNTPIGRFDEGPEVQSIDCLQGAKNAATHTNEGKKNEVKLVWHAPTDLQESVKFRITVVKKADIYWVGYLTQAVTVQ